MIDRQHGQVVFECDDCGQTLETGESDFGDAMNAYKDEGWRSKKERTGWLHLCPDCINNPS